MMKLATSFLAATLLASIYASPISTVEMDSLVERAATIDATLFSKIKYYAQYAAAAYCNQNDDSSGTPITCTQGNCPDVEAAAATSVLEFDNSAITGIQGFVSTSAARSEIVLSFRGSASIRNFLADLNIALVDFICSSCKVHDGFFTAWQEPRTQIIAAINAARQNYPSYNLVITGHSLGGAVATLAAADLRAQGIPADLFTYGSPRTGNRQFAEFVSAQSGINARTTHINDPIPRLPPLVLTPFRHTTPEYWLSNGGPRKTDYVLSDVKVCEGTASLGCNAGTIPSLDLDTHNYYFEWISECAPNLAWKKKREELTSPAVRRWIPEKKMKRDVASDEQLLQWMQQDIEYGAEVEKRDTEKKQ